VNRRFLYACAELITQEPITEAVVARLVLDETAEELADRIETAVVEGALVLQIRVTHTDPELAASIANALADELMRWGGSSNHERQQFIEWQLRDLRERIAEVGAEIGVLDASLDESASGVEVYNAWKRMAALKRALSRYQDAYAILLAAHLERPPKLLSLVEPAATPTQPVSRKTGLIVGVAGLAGLGITYGAASLVGHPKHRSQSATLGLGE
jgi:uncharacterized protein involved in exopolysaccharide biosynthesis